MAADGPFRGDGLVRGLEEARKRRERAVAFLRRERRERVIDAVTGLVGTGVGMLHLHAPWVVILEILHAVWMLQSYVALVAAYGTWCAFEAVRLHRRLSRLT